MVKLPKSKKGIASGLVSSERVHKIIVGTIVATGVGLGAVGTAQALPNAQPASQSSLSVKKDAVLFLPAGQRVKQVADHYSHESHYSHASHDSHSSHYSHYSSRY